MPFGKVASALLGYKETHSSINAQLSTLDINARMVRMQMQQAKERAVFDQVQYARALSQLVGGQKAGYAAGGVKVEAGSPQAVSMASVMVGKEDLEQIRTNLKRQVEQYSAQLVQFAAQWKALKRAKRQAKKVRAASIITAFTTAGGQAGTAIGEYFLNKGYGTGNDVQVETITPQETGPSVDSNTGVPIYPPPGESYSYSNYQFNLGYGGLV